MPDADKFMSDGAENGFPFCPEKVNVSGYDYWTSLGGWSKASTPADDAAKAQSIADSRANAMKLFWNYNGHAVDVDLGGTQTLTIDIEQGDFDGGSATAPFKPKDRVCITRGWNAWVEFDDGGEYADTEVGISPRRMYDGSTDNEDNFVGYGVVNPSGGGSAFGTTNISGSFRFDFSSYLDNDEPTEPWTFEYSDAIEEGMWFVASAEDDNSGSTSIDGLEATFSGTTITYKDFDFYTYPA